jgi:hypothetical protein
MTANNTDNIQDLHGLRIRRWREISQWRVCMISAIWHFQISHVRDVVFQVWQPKDISVHSFRSAVVMELYHSQY